MCSSYSLLQAVTEVNKRQYIHHLAKYLMVGRIAKQLEAFMEGKHRSRIKTKEKSKVVASVWGGEEFIQFLAAQAVLHWTI